MPLFVFVVFTVIPLNEFTLIKIRILQCRLIYLSGNILIIIAVCYSRSTKIFFSNDYCFPFRCMIKFGKLF